jgi:hypothetical protein
MTAQAAQQVRFICTSAEHGPDGLAFFTPASLVWHLRRERQIGGEWCRGMAPACSSGVHSEPWGHQGGYEDCTCECHRNGWTR